MSTRKLDGFEHRKRVEIFNPIIYKSVCGKRIPIEILVLEYRVFIWSYQPLNIHNVPNPLVAGHQNGW